MALADREDVKILVLWRCPYAIRALIGLRLKNIKHEVIHEDLSNKSELLLASNPIHKKVPVLIHHGEVVVESLIILEYLDEAWPRDPATGRPGFLPSDPLLRSQQRFWADFVSNKFMVSLYRVRASSDGAAKQAANSEFAENFAVLDGALERTGARFFGGEEIGLADIALAPSAAFLPVLVKISGLILPPGNEHLKRWFEIIKEIPAVEAVLPDTGKLEQAMLEQLKTKAQIK